MGEFPSGQRGQTVNLLSVTSVVRIHLPPPKNIHLFEMDVFYFVDLKGGSWQGAGGALQPPWLFRRKANPPSPTKPDRHRLSGFFIPPHGSARPAVQCPNRANFRTSCSQRPPFVKILVDNPKITQDSCNVKNNFTRFLLKYLTKPSL